MEGLTHADNAGRDWKSASPFGSIQVYLFVNQVPMSNRNKQSTVGGFGHYINKMNLSGCSWVQTAAIRILVGKQDCGRGDGGRARGWTTARIPTVDSECSDSVRM